MAVEPAPARWCAPGWAGGLHAWVLRGAVAGVCDCWRLAWVMVLLGGAMSVAAFVAL